MSRRRWVPGCCSVPPLRRAGCPPRRVAVRAAHRARAVAVTARPAPRPAAEFSPRHTGSQPPQHAHRGDRRGGCGGSSARHARPMRAVSKRAPPKPFKTGRARRGSTRLEVRCAAVRAGKTAQRRAQHMLHGRGRLGWATAWPALACRRFARRKHATVAEMGALISHRRRRLNSGPPRAEI